MKLFYRKMGAGRPVVIIHGLYGSSDNWLSIGRELSEDFEVYLVDQRNHGKSPHAAEHNYEVLRDDMLGFMNDAGLEKAILAGHSMGGKTAMCFARNYPDRVSSLIVIDIAPKSYKDLARSKKFSHYSIMKAMKNIDFPSASSRRDIESMLAESIPQERIRRFLMKNIGQGKDRKYFWKLNVDVLLSELNNIMDGENETCFAGTPVMELPVLFIRGENSSYILDEDMDQIRKIFPSAMLETIPGAGHWLHAEQPGAFIKVVSDFLRTDKHIIK
jgi:esterase